ncbi:MAG: cell division protein FtsZ, partial [Bacilli bacterium]
MNYKIKVFGIGGGGSNTTDFIIKSKLKGIETYSINTDAQALENANAEHKIHIGKELTKGLGAGALPEIGRKAAEESHEELALALEGADIVFIASGMGGGTGTGAAPYIAEISKSMGILTIAVVTKPFAFEGVSRMNMAIDGLKRLETQADVTIVIPNEKLIENHKDKYIEDAFVLPDDILKTAVDSIIRMLDAVSNVGVNVDLNTLKVALKDKGLAVMGIGESEASDLTPAENLQEALKKAVDSNILEISIKGATQFIVLIGGNIEYLTPSEAEDVENFL